MFVVRFLLVFVEIVSSLLLVGAILIQRTRSQGMGMAFGAGMGESLFGGQVGNVLTRATVVLGVVFLVNTSALAILYARTPTEEVSVTDKVPVPAPVPAPGGVTEQPGAPTAGSTPPGAPAEAPSAPIEIPAGAEPVAAPAVEVPAAQPEAAPAPAAPVVDAPPAAEPAPAAP